MTPTDHLKEEHQEILLMLKILESVCTEMGAKERVDVGHLERIVEFFKIFVDECHHGKEEDLLFPAILPMERRLIGSLLGEHSQGRSYVRAMDRGLARTKKGQGEGRGEYVANAQKYIALLTEHIQKEDSVFFPAVERILGKKKQEELAQGFEHLERKKIGEETREKFRSLLHYLEEIYLK